MRRPDGSSEDSARPRLTSSDGPRPFHRAHHLRPVGEFLWADGPPSYAARLTRLRQWLASYGHDPAALPEPVLGVLAHADSGSEVRLVLALLRAGPWTAVGERTVSDGARSITLQAPIGPYRADFLVEEPEVAPFVVEVDGPTHDTDSARRADAVRQAVIEAAGFPVVRVRSTAAARVGAALATAYSRAALEDIGLLDDPLDDLPRDEASLGSPRSS